jgi:hypothetical protein
MVDFDLLNSILSFIASIVSLILSIVAIFLSAYFYTQAKNTEKAVSEALIEIKTQTGNLDKLTGKLLDRLTRFVTSPQPMDATQEKLLEMIRDKIVLQGTDRTGIVENREVEPLMYKEEMKPQFVKADAVKPKKGRKK